ncbi:hypothetical protein OH77DRAFT_792541 [Trametes cingulata]|nr:hypothetical protein OH77DRAFT_792541 [Trametes cingulata]
MDCGPTHATLQRLSLCCSCMAAFMASPSSTPFVGTSAPLGSGSGRFAFRGPCMVISANQALLLEEKEGRHQTRLCSPAPGTAARRVSAAEEGVTPKVFSRVERLDNPIPGHLGDHIVRQTMYLLPQATGHPETHVPAEDGKPFESIARCQAPPLQGYRHLWSCRGSHGDSYRRPTSGSALLRRRSV